VPGGVKPCRSASHTGYPSRTATVTNRDETALARLAATGPPEALDRHPTGRFVEERKKPGIEAEAHRGARPGESLRYRK